VNLFNIYSIQSLQKLQRLMIPSNNITNLPPAVYTLSSLKALDISSNESLTSLDPEIQNLTQLQSLFVYSCNALTSPPLATCMRGVHAVNCYYTQLAS